jgi:hypothetical protein
MLLDNGLIATLSRAAFSGTESGPTGLSIQCPHEHNALAAARQALIDWGDGSTALKAEISKAYQCGSSG